MRGGVFVAAVLGSAAFACAKDEVLAVDLSGQPDAKLAFLLVLDASGAPEWVSEPFAIERGRFVPEPPAAYLGISEGARAFYVAIDPDELARAVPELARDRIASSRVIAMTPPPSPRVIGAVEGLDGTIEAALPPAAASVLERTGGGALVAREPEGFSGLTIVLPARFEVCGGAEPPSLRPFGDRPALLPPADFGTDTDETYLRRLMRLDERRVLALTRERLWLLVRGEPANLARSLSAPEAFGTPDVDASFTSMALDTSSSAGTAQVLVSGCSPSCPGAGRVLRLSVRDLTLSVHGEVPIEPPPAPPDAPRGSITDLVVDPNGAAVFVTERGRVYVRAAGARSFTLTQQLDPGHEPERLGLTYRPDAPHALAASAAGAGGVIYVGDAAGSWQRVAILAGVTLHVEGIAATADGADLWSVVREGTIYRRANDGALSVIAPRLPPRWSACTGRGTATEPELEGHLGDVAVAGDHAYVLADACTALFRVRRSDGCVSVIRRGDEDIAKPAGSKPRINVTAHAGAGFLTVGGPDGLLYELEL